VTIMPDHLDAFRARLNEIARRSLKPEDLQPPLRLDSEVALPEVSRESLAVLDRLKPFGQANPAVQFFARHLTHARPLQRMGAEKQHVKLWVTDGSVTHEAVWWNGGGESLPVGEFDLAFAPGLNEFNGRTTVQLKVLDWRPAAAGDSQ
jgi:single-stranded-DNA-specific exonuclease